MNLPIHSDLEPIMKAAGKLAGSSGSKAIKMKHVLVALVSNVPGPGAGISQSMLDGCPDCEELNQFARRVKRAAKVRKSPQPKKPRRRLSEDAQELFNRASKTAWLSGHKKLTISHLMEEILFDRELRGFLVEAGSTEQKLDRILQDIRRTASCFVSPVWVYHVRRLSEEQVDKIRRSGLAFSEMTDATGRFVRLTGEDLLRVCELLDCYILTTYQQDGSFSRWNEAVIRSRKLEDPALSHIEVQADTHFCDGHDSMRSAVLERLLRETILPVVRRPVHLGLSCSVYNGFNDQNRFAIWLDATKKQTAIIPAPTHILGVEHKYLIGVRAPAEVDRPYIDSSTGHYFAELVRGTDLYLHQGFKARSDSWGPAIPERTGPSLALLAAVLDECASRLAEEPEFDTTEIEKILAEVTAATPHDGLPEAHYPIISNFGFMHRRRRELLHGLIKEVLMRGMNRRVNVTHFGTGAGQRQEQLLNVLEDPQSYTVVINARRLETGPPLDWFWPILDGQGNVAADVTDDCLRIYSDPMTHGSIAEAKRLADILLCARRYLRGDRASRSAMLRQCYAQMCLQQLTTARSSQAQEDVTLLAADAHLRAAMETAREKESDLLLVSMEHEFSREFDSLVDLEKVRELTVTDEELVVETDTIFCTNPQTGVVHELGRFKIHINLTERVPRFLNQTRTVRTNTQRQHAPHVGESGHPCLGSISDVMPELIRRRQFVLVIQLCLAFLESVNPDDSWGRQIVDFPVAAEVR